MLGWERQWRHRDAQRSGRQNQRETIVDRSGNHRSKCLLLSSLIRDIPKAKLLAVVYFLLPSVCFCRLVDSALALHAPTFSSFQNIPVAVDGFCQGPTGERCPAPAIPTCSPTRALPAYFTHPSIRPPIHVPSSADLTESSFPVIPPSAHPSSVMRPVNSTAPATTRRTGPGAAGVYSGPCCLLTDRNSSGLAFTARRGVEL